VVHCVVAVVIELSDLAWTIIDPTGEQELLERSWTAMLPDDWAPAEGVDELRVRLSEITERVDAAEKRAVLEVVGAVIVYLAAHPERRRVESAVIGEALREEYGECLPQEIAAWLVGQPSIMGHFRSHGASEPRRHFHSRPLGGSQGD